MSIGLQLFTHVRTTASRVVLASVMTMVVALPAIVAAQEPSGPREGIAVHGHWVIEVRNPDGTMAARRAFSNDLGPRGALALVNLISRSNSMGKWVMAFDGGGSVSSPPSPCSGARCVISEGTGATLFGSDVLVGTDATLLPNTTTPALQIRGSGTVPANGTVGRVFTSFGLCASSLTAQNPCQYVGPVAFNFTEASAPAKFTAVDVIAGQIVQITVTFTFS